MRKISHKLHAVMEKIAFIIKYTYGMINEDRILLIFFASTFAMDFIVKLSSGMNYLNVRSFLFNFTWYALIVALSYFFKSPQRRRRYFISMTTLNFAFTLGNIIYYRYYESFLSLSIVKQVSLFAAMPDSGDIGLELVSIFDVFTVLIFILSIIFYLKFTKDNQDAYAKKNEAMRKYTRGNFFRMAGISFVFGIIMLQGRQYSQLVKLWNRPIVVENFGLATYHLVDSVKSTTLFIERTVNEEDYQRFIEFYEEKNRVTVTNEFTNRYKDKNVIMVHAESIETFLINATWEDQVITPNINKLARTGYNFSNTYPQQSVGTSSDTEFTIATGLLPVNNGTIFLDHFDNTYLTMQHLLKEEGYKTLSFHGNNGSFWNRSIMHPQLGYDRFYEKNDFEPIEEEDIIGLGISDEAFFKRSVDYLEEYYQAGERFYANLIMLTNHTPWKDHENYVVDFDEDGNPLPFQCGVLEKRQLCDYLKAAHYADYAIGQLMNDLEARGMLDDTVIVIYGDHPVNIKMKEMGIFYDKPLSVIEYKAQQKVPFIIWSDDIDVPREFTQTIGLYNAAPILQNMLGIHNPFNLGNDYQYDAEQTLEEKALDLHEMPTPTTIHGLNPNDYNIVPFVNEDWTDGIIYYDSFRRDFVMLDSSVDPSWITDEYLAIQMQRVEELLTISNLINRYNLIQKYYEDQVEIAEAGELYGPYESDY